MQHKVVTDKDGRMRTEQLPPPLSPAEMERFRRDVHDHISGNSEPWHVDPNAKKPPAEPPLPTIYDDPDYWCGVSHA